MYQLLVRKRPLSEKIQNRTINRRLLSKRRKKRRLRLIFLSVCVIALVPLCIAGTGKSTKYTGGSNEESNVSFLSEIPVLRESVQLNVEKILQNPELPNGCEATSLTIALNYLGVPAEKTSIAYNYVPNTPFFIDAGRYYAPDPAEEYAGDPASSLGFYCLESPIIQGANRYLSEAGSRLKAVDLTNATLDTLKEYLNREIPVIFWCTQDYSDKATYHDNFFWYLPDNSLYKPYSNLHCIVLSGYNGESFTVCDPLKGILTLSQDDVLAGYRALGSHAVSFRDTDASP